ncbi:MAG: hypothetical protein GF404_08495 [candidate division Zixibacteria bacterium]|nr:hypothetical protein [candidate division Zixibacteria bacterium]
MTSGEISIIGFFHGRILAPDKRRELKTCHNEARDIHFVSTPEHDSFSG